MASQPAHAQWCPEHERYYRGACPFCRDDVPANRIPKLEREKPPPRSRPPGDPRSTYRLGDRLVTPDRAKVQALREARGWTRTELARHARLGSGHIGQIETGRQQRQMTLETARRLAEALDTTVAALTKEEGSP